ncbi:MotA/TolQ/ExbB proton channel family protein [Larsenimonas rhizosphaerae]|uniref:MotA/TolQ/ExbB proton channel family protein n=1 Tax=Larsenimonas rhizosphaerae TaxID=2944682 RepID=A0AA41ZFG0_9GAMM|nr:MotA/TolQ/ExbB proton channel family protein [Larsenimonas rhizosphaerae]MCM2130946.1 MotA/TolQ/ExbB proton channel family protein [Larsenimonas rhizosphaerae]MCX2523651.1 MotA/TolQ/ExbB proton channel family protein [Larsenimonas rhizosphaerae]
MSPLLDPIARLSDAGGPVLVLIMLVAMLLFALALERWIYWRLGYRRDRRALLTRWQARQDHVSWSARTLRTCWSDELLGTLRGSLPWLKVLVALCPLLGLLGTVTGMIQVFDTLSLSGTGQSRAMSDGVARATLPTLAGMAVAVVGLLFAGHFEHIVRREGQRLHDRMARAIEERVDA